MAPGPRESSSDHEPCAKGPGHKETEEASGRARRLCQRRDAARVRVSSGSERSRPYVAGAAQNPILWRYAVHARSPARCDLHRVVPIGVCGREHRHEPEHPSPSRPSGSKNRTRTKKEKEKKKKHHEKVCGKVFSLCPETYRVRYRCLHVKIKSGMQAGHAWAGRRQQQRCGIRARAAPPMHPIAVYHGGNRIEPNLPPNGRHPLHQRLQGLAENPAAGVWARVLLRAGYLRRRLPPRALSSHL